MHRTGQDSGTYVAGGKLQWSFVVRTHLQGLAYQKPLFVIINMQYVVTML